MIKSIKPILFLVFVFQTHGIMAQINKAGVKELVGKVPVEVKVVKLKHMPISCVKDVKIDSFTTIRFECRAIKYKKTWVLVLSDSTANHVARLNPESMELLTTSDFFTEGILRVVKQFNFRLKQKYHAVDDLLLYRYFKPGAQAKDYISMLFELETGIKEPHGITKVLPFLKIFKKPKIKIPLVGG